MNRHENESDIRESPKPQQPTPPTLPTAKAQQFEPPVRLPQNFDDWEIRRREDDPSR
jgi:hypothetical protein